MFQSSGIFKAGEGHTPPPNACMYIHVRMYTNARMYLALVPPPTPPIVCTPVRTAVLLCAHVQAQVVPAHLFQSMILALTSTNISPEDHIILVSPQDRSTVSLTKTNYLWPCPLIRHWVMIAILNINSLVLTPNITALSGNAIKCNKPEVIQGLFTRISPFTYNSSSCPTVVIL